MIVDDNDKLFQDRRKVQRRKKEENIKKDKRAEERRTKLQPSRGKN